MILSEDGLCVARPATDLMRPDGNLSRWRNRTDWQRPVSPLQSGLPYDTLRRNTLSRLTVSHDDQIHMADDDSKPSEQPALPHSDDDVTEHAELTDRIARGDCEALGELFAIYRPRLWRMVTFRLHPGLHGRIDADDVLQDAWIRAVDRIQHFFDVKGESSFLWFRAIVIQTMLDLHRFHLGTQKRSTAREYSIDEGWHNGSTSSCLAFHLSDSARSPSSNASRSEVSKQLDSVLSGMNEIDREVLALRHFEALSNREVAKLLGMTEQAASVRYVRALGRLKQILELVMPGIFLK
jgi:RNA polymerase sigma-70 factor (ECF subfamily)